MAYKVLALLHGQLLPLPKGVNVSVVKNICASNKTSRKPSCDAGPCGKAGLPISVLLALSSLFLKMCHSYLSSLPCTKRSPATFSLVFHSIVPVLSFTYFQVCCIYCYITWCCCTVKCNRAHTYGILKPTARRGIYRQKHGSELDCWCHSQNIHFCKLITIWSKVCPALTQRIERVHSTTATASRSCSVWKVKWNKHLFSFLFFFVILLNRRTITSYLLLFHTQETCYISLTEELSSGKVSLDSWSFPYNYGWKINILV